MTKLPEILGLLRHGSSKDACIECLQCLRTSCGGPRPPCTRPGAMLCVSVCRGGAQKYLEELDVKAVGIKHGKKEAMAKM